MHKEVPLSMYLRSLGGLLECCFESIPKQTFFWKIFIKHSKQTQVAILQNTGETLPGGSGIASSSHFAPSCCGFSFLSLQEDESVLPTLWVTTLVCPGLAMVHDVGCFPISFEIQMREDSSSSVATAAMNNYFLLLHSRQFFFSHAKPDYIKYIFLPVSALWKHREKWKCHPHTRAQHQRNSLQLFQTKQQCAA